MILIRKLNVNVPTKTLRSYRDINICVYSKDRREKNFSIYLSIDSIRFRINISMSYYHFNRKNIFS